MDKQMALDTLRQDLSLLSLDDLSSRKILFQTSVYLYSPPKSPLSECMEAVKIVMQREKPVRDDIYNGHIALSGVKTWRYTLDGDLELLVSCATTLSDPPSPDFRTHSVVRVEVRRRQVIFPSEKKLIPVALKIRKEHRSVLPASASIIAQEGNYVIVVPEYSEVLGKHKVFDLQKRFISQWINDTVFVRRIPDEDTARTSRSEKTSYFHKVLAHNPVAGYAEWVLETRGQVGNTQDTKTSLEFVYYSATEKARRFQLEGQEALKMFQIATSSFKYWNPELIS